MRLPANIVAVRATQKAIRAGGVTKRGDVNNLNVRPDTPVPRPIGQPKGKGGGRGGGKGGGGVIQSGKPCFCKAFEGQCGEPKCPHAHDKKAMDEFKAKMGANFEDKRKRWLGAGGIGREAGPPSAPKQRAHATIKGEADKDTKGTKYNLFGDGAKKGKGGSHITYAVRAPINEGNARTIPRAVRNIN